MNIAHYIHHPEHLDRDTLYELRSLLALYPYYQTARLLLLHNLFLLHDPTFDHELRRAAVYITDRRVLFRLVEQAHYQLQPAKQAGQAQLGQLGQLGRICNPGEPGISFSSASTPPSTLHPQPSTLDPQPSTIDLIDDFLDTLPADQRPDTDVQRPRRRPTAADAAVDYMSYLLQTEAFEAEEQAGEAPQLNRQDLIDTFIENDKGRIVLPPPADTPPPVADTPADSDNNAPPEVYTETLARIYIRQGNFSRALQIIKQLSLDDSKKNAYFADQMRFLEKLIINNNKKNK